MKLVLLELARSVSQLRSDQQFIVVFFSDRTFPMMAPRSIRRLIVATPEHRAGVLRWASTVRPTGGTDPRGAIRLGLGLSPDVVYLLTDGEIPEDTPDLIRHRRNGSTVVHTICVGGHAAEAVMRQIAQENGGRFTAVR